LTAHNDRDHDHDDRGGFFHHHGHHHSDTRRILVSFAVRQGQAAHLTATADDPSGALDTNAVDTWVETDINGVEATSGFVSLTPNGTNCDVPWVAEGSTYVVARATDPDGNAVDSAPVPIICLAATDAASVSVTGSVS
jgi:hypothetical protein